MKTQRVAVIVTLILSLVAGCAGNKPMETGPTPVYSPITITNAPDESKAANSTNSLPARRLGRREQPQTLAEAGVRKFSVPEQKLGDYDKAFVNSVQQQWYDLLDRSAYDFSTKGKVILEFRLLRDGSISDIEVVQTTMNGDMTKLCKQAILNPAPFPPWPPSMRLQTGKDYRKIQFSFYFDEEHISK